MSCIEVTMYAEALMYLGGAVGLFALMLWTIEQNAVFCEWLYRKIRGEHE